MNDKNKDAPLEQSTSDDINQATNQAGDPGSTPGSAEGDEEIVDEALRQHAGE